MGSQVAAFSARFFARVVLNEAVPRSQVRPITTKVAPGKKLAHAATVASIVPSWVRGT